MTDYRVGITVKNARILRLMEREGYYTVPEFARAAGMSQHQLYSFVNLKLSPFRTNGEWKQSVIAISEALRCLPDDLFSEKQLEGMPNNRRSFDVGEGDLTEFIEGATQRALPPDEKMISDEIYKALEEGLDGLPERQQAIIKMYYGIGCAAMNMTQIAEIYDRSVTTVSNQIWSAHRKLRAGKRLIGSHIDVVDVLASDT